MARSGRQKILILDRGNVELGYPRNWTVKPDPAGFLTIVDPTDSCKLEISYMRLPPMPEGGPPPQELLRGLLEGTEHAQAAQSITHSEVAGVRSAWTDYAYECDDTEKKLRRKAHGRMFIATNGRFQVLVTFYYWKDDASWAVVEWERMVSTLQLGDGTQLARPEDHWSMRNPE